MSSFESGDHGTLTPGQGEVFGSKFRLGLSWTGRNMPRGGQGTISIQR